MTMRCKKHPQYEAKRRGRSGCLKCRLIYWLVGKGIVKAPTTRRRRVGKLPPAFKQAAATMPKGKVEHPPLPGIETETPADTAAVERMKNEGGR